MTEDRNELNELFENIDINNIDIFEPEVDKDLQIEFIEHLLHRRRTEDDDIQTHIELLFDEKTGSDKKKDLIVGLVSSDNVQAYRALEKFELQENDELLKMWVRLGIHKMRNKFDLLFTDKPKKYLLTSALGGKGTKLRYFCIFTPEHGIKFDALKCDIAEKEIIHFFKKYECDIEQITKDMRFVSFVCLIPINVSVRKLFGEIISSINQLGNFISDKCLINNVKRLSKEEIDQFLDS